jgi:hypothetical protein
MNAILFISFAFNLFKILIYLIIQWLFYFLFYSFISKIIITIRLSVGIWFEFINICFIFSNVFRFLWFKIILKIRFIKVFIFLKHKNFFSDFIKIRVLQYFIGTWSIGGINLQHISNKLNGILTGVVNL